MSILDIDNFSVHNRFKTYKKARITGSFLGIIFFVILTLFNKELILNNVDLFIIKFSIYPIVAYVIFGLFSKMYRKKVRKLILQNIIDGNSPVRAMFESAIIFIHLFMFSYYIGIVLFVICANILMLGGGL